MDASADLRVWFFRPGTEDRVEVIRMEREGGTHWGLPCHFCGIYFALRPEHGVSVGKDGAISTVQAFNCPKCGNWHATISGGVVEAC